MNRYELIAIVCAHLYLVNPVSANDIAPYRISSITEGRLITEDGKIVSLYGLQFPDSVENPMEFERALDRLSSLVFGGLVTLDTSLFEEAGSEMDRYGDRHSKVLDPSGRWIQQELVEQGFVWWSGAAKYPKQLRRSLVAAERRAEETRSGVWREFRTLNANTLTSLPESANFVIAEGRVLNVYRSAKMTFINFGEDWKTDFTAAISSKNRRKFETQDWKLSALMHKLIRIRGSVRWYNGPYMELSFPEQLEIGSPQSN